MSHVAKYLLYYPAQWMRREPVRSCLRDLKKAEQLPRAQLEEWQNIRLGATIRHATECIPFYRERYRCAGLTAGSVRHREEIAGLPVVTKSDLRNHMTAMRCGCYAGPLTYKTTGGSTGEAVTILKDRLATAYARGAMWRNYSWWGIDIGDRQARFWGVPIRQADRIRYRAIDLLSNRIRLSSFGFRDDDLLAYYRRLKSFRPRYLYGYASMIYEFASFLRRSRLSLSVPLAITTSEVLYDSQKETISQALGCQVINEYGCGEVGPIAFECPKGGLHLMADNLYVEIIKQDGTPAKCGEIGEVVITELHSKAMPLIRYKIMDSVEVGEPSCECGRGLPLIRRVVGRAYDYLVSSSGQRYHGEKVMYLLELLKDRGMGVRLVQVRQKSPSELEVRVVREPGFRREALEMMRRYFAEALGDRVEARFLMVDEIPRERSGKFRVVVNEL